MAVFGLWCWGEERQQPPAKEETALIMDLTLGADSSLSCKWAVVPEVGRRHGVSPLNRRLTAFYMYITGIQQMWQYGNTSFCQCFMQENLHAVYIPPRRAGRGRRGQRGKRWGKRELEIRQIKNSMEKVICVFSSPPPWWMMGSDTPLGIHL